MNKGDTFNPVVTVLKEKNGLPTSIKINNHTYALVHNNTVNGAKNKANKKKQVIVCGNG